MAAVVVAVMAAATNPAAQVQSDHADGNMPGQVNYWLVEEGELRVCDNSTRVTTAELNGAIAMWNNGIGATLLVSDCTNSGVVVVNAPEDTCIPAGTGEPIACAEFPDTDPDTGAPQPRIMNIEPDAPIGNNDRMTDLVAHELGHNLGFHHTPVNSESCNPNSIMGAALCTPSLGELKQIDIDNYHDGYHADAVASFRGNLAGLHVIRFAWDGSDIHNERGYLINWRNNCTGEWQPLTFVSKNLSVKTVTGLQGGQQEFQILPLTFADPQHAPPFAGEARNVTVDVFATLFAPVGMAASFPSTTVNRFVWPAVSGADHYKIIRADVPPSGLFTPHCTGPITGTQYDDALPTDHLTVLYRRVVACTAPPDNLCSPLSAAYTVSELFEDGVWKYVSTYYRSLDDIDLQFINFNPNLNALQLHILDGDAAGNPVVADSACIPVNTIDTVGPMQASSFTFPPGKLATRGHGILNAGACATTHGSDSGTVGWGFIPPATGPCSPFDCGELTNDGSLAGVSDLLIGDLNGNKGHFYCIVKTTHQASDNRIQTFQQCNVDIENAGQPPVPPEDALVPPTWEDTCVTLAERDPPECESGQLRNLSETGPDALPGPPPPPPYTIAAPSEGFGAFYPGGAGAPGGVCGSTDCTVVTTCFEDVGPIAGTGPNIIWTSIILDPGGGVTVQADTDGDGNKDTQVGRVSSGSVSIWYNQNNASCTNLLPKGAPDFAGQPLQSIHAYGKGGSNPNSNPAPWRPAATGPPGMPTVFDFDGDGCTDEAELASVPGCGDDPQNPSDSFDPATADLSGIYELSARIIRGDCTGAQCATEAPGAYFFCRADLQHDTATNGVVLRPYCYWDAVTVDINPEAYLGITGDGMAGAPPPGPQAPAQSLNFAFGDVDLAHAELTGAFDESTGMLTISGCIADQDSQETLGNLWVELTVSAHQVPGTADIWINQNPGCDGSPLAPTPDFDDAELSMVRANPNKGGGYDQDGDGVPTQRELAIHPITMLDDELCGRRDPYNKNDYYDVSIPRDGVIDLPNDILGVILHFAPGGYDPGDENWDRPPTMAGAGAGSSWNRGSPDTVIDLPNDILGVILQFNPGGCPPLS